MSYPELWKLRDAHFEPDREDSMAQFKLAFDQSLIPKLAARYSYQEDIDALQAGKGISKARWTRARPQPVALPGHIKVTDGTGNREAGRVK